MADIFISYAKKDREKVEPIANALNEQGWSVFWDRAIPGGKTWDEVIEEELDAAKCVVVVWSKISIKSRWVRAEAEEGLHRNILVPVSIEDVKIPLLFRPIQSVRLIHWEGDSSHPQFVKLISDLSPILGPSPLKIKEAEEKRLKEERKRKQEEERKAAEEKRLKEQELKRKTEEERLKKEAEAKRKAEEERKKKEIEEQRKIEEKRKLEEAEQNRIEAARKAEEERRQKEAESKRKAEEEKRRRENEKLKRISEKKERKRKDEETKRQAEEERKRKEVERERKRQVEIKDDPPKLPTTATFKTETAKDEVKLAKPKTSVQVSTNEKPAKKNRATIVGILIASFLVIVLGAILHFRQDDTKVKQEQKVETKPIKTSSPQKFSNSTGMKFALIPAGKFFMGSPPGEPGRDEHEKQHEVIISKPFYLQTTEVSQGQWKKVMGDNPSYFKYCGEDCPVENVSWEDTQKFISKLNQMESTKKYRLPTEAEWEYACRAGTETAYSFEDKVDKLGEYGWHWDNSKRHLHPGGEKKPNAWDLYDMHGNVWEWCQDWYGDYSTHSVVDPKGPDKGQYRVLRGGSWSFSARYLRSAYRYGHFPVLRLNFYGLGFRVARDF